MVVVMETEAKLESEKEKSEEYLAAITKYQEKLREMEMLMGQMEQHNEELETKASDAAEQLDNLREMIEPFKEQLEGFEMEKKSLLESKEASKEEVSFNLLYSIIHCNIKYVQSWQV